MAEPGQHAGEGQPVVAEVERHRHHHAVVGTQAGPPHERGGGLRGQELGAVDLAAVGDGAVHAGQRTRGGHSVGGRDLTVQQRRFALNHGLDTREVDRAERGGERQRGEVRRHHVEQRVLQRALRADDLRGVGGCPHRGPAQVQPVGAQRLGHFGAHEFPHTGSGDGPGQSGEQPAEGERVVGGFAVQPTHRGRGEALLHTQMVEQVGLSHAVQLGQPGSVPQNIADGDRGLAVGAERPPVLGHRGVVIDQPPIDQTVDDCRRDPLGGREDHRSGVGRPVLRTAAVTEPGPHVDDRLAVEVDRQGSTTEPPPREHLRERAHCQHEVLVGGALHPSGQRRAVDAL